MTEIPQKVLKRYVWNAATSMSTRTLMRTLNALTRGVDFAGCTKAQMLESILADEYWEGWSEKDVRAFKAIERKELENKEQLAIFKRQQRSAMDSLIHTVGGAQ